MSLSGMAGSLTIEAFVQLLEDHLPQKKQNKTKQKTNCAANGLGGLLVQSKEGLLHLIL